MATAVDPICKMDVDTESPPGGCSDHNGTTYYFCAPGCKVAFDKEPERYLDGPPETPSQGKGSFFLQQALPPGVLRVPGVGGPGSGAVMTGGDG